MDEGSVSPKDGPMFIANSEIRVRRSAAAAHGVIVVDVNGSVLRDTDSRAMARVESFSVISNGAAVSSDSMLVLLECNETFGLRKLRAILNWPNRVEPVAAATARSNAMALAGLLETLFPRE